MTFLISMNSKGPIASFCIFLFLKYIFSSVLNVADDTPTTTVNFEKISLMLCVDYKGFYTHGTCEGTHTFQACALNHSATSPNNFSI